MMLSLSTAYRSFDGEVEASSTPTICRLPDSRRHQIWAIAQRVLGFVQEEQRSQGRSDAVTLKHTWLVWVALFALFIILTWRRYSSWMARAWSADDLRDYLAFRDGGFASNAWRFLQERSHLSTRDHEVSRIL